MIMNKTLIATAVLASAAVGSANAAVLASTDFDASSNVASNVKTGLNWTLNGLVDPGDMTALNAASNPQTIFNGSALTQDNFTPGLNVGNGNTFWTTDINITVAAGFIVTLEDITFNGISVNGGQALNVNRRNDFTAFLISPSAVAITDVTVADTVAGASQPLVTLDLVDTLLSEPGTYILRIKGGDFAGVGETGNHTGIDNLSINGTAAPIPEPGSLALLGLGGLLIARRRRG